MKYKDFCIDAGKNYGFLFRINYKNFIRIRGTFKHPKIYIRLFDKLIIDK